MKQYKTLWREIENLNKQLPPPPKNIDTFLLAIPEHLDTMRDNVQYISFGNGFRFEENAHAHAVCDWIAEHGAEFSNHPEDILNRICNGYNPEDKKFIQWGLNQTYRMLFILLPIEVTQLLND